MAWVRIRPPDDHARNGRHRKTTIGTAMRDTYLGEDGVATITAAIACHAFRGRAAWVSGSGGKSKAAWRSCMSMHAISSYLEAHP